MCTSLPGFFVWVLKVDLEVPSLAWCIRYFSVAVVKLHGHNSLSKKELIWARGSRNFKSITWDSMSRGRKLRTHILDLKHGAETVNLKWQETFNVKECHW